MIKILKKWLRSKFASPENLLPSPKLVKVDRAIDDKVNWTSRSITFSTPVTTNIKNK